MSPAAFPSSLWCGPNMVFLCSLHTWCCGRALLPCSWQGCSELLVAEGSSPALCRPALAGRASWRSGSSQPVCQSRLLDCVGSREGWVSRVFSWLLVLSCFLECYLSIWGVAQPWFSMSVLTEPSVNSQSCGYTLSLCLSCTRRDNR